MSEIAGLFGRLPDHMLDAGRYTTLYHAKHVFSLVWWRTYNKRNPFMITSLSKLMTVGCLCFLKKEFLFSKKNLQIFSPFSFTLSRNKAASDCVRGGRQSWGLWSSQLLRPADKDAGVGPSWKNHAEPNPSASVHDNEPPCWHVWQQLLVSVCTDVVSFDLHADKRGWRCLPGNGSSSSLRQSTEQMSICEPRSCSQDVVQVASIVDTCDSTASHNFNSQDCYTRPSGRKNYPAEKKRLRGRNMGGNGDCGNRYEDPFVHYYSTSEALII